MTCRFNFDLGSESGAKGVVDGSMPTIDDIML